MAEEKKQKKKRNKKRTVCAIIIGFMMICFWLIVFLLLFQVRKINITGNEFLTKQVVADWIQKDELSTNSLYLFCKYHFTEYEKLPAVEDVKVTLSNPWTVNVKVKEKEIVGYIVVDDEFVYFDKDGLVLEKSRDWKDDIPGIEGINVTRAELYKELPVSEGYKKVFSNLLEMSSSLKKYKLKPDRILCMEEDICLFFGNKCVLLGNKNYTERIAQIPPIFEKLGDKSGVLHLERFNDVNTTITFTEGELPEIPKDDPEEEVDETESRNAGEETVQKVDPEAGEQPENEDIEGQTEE